MKRLVAISVLSLLFLAGCNETDGVELKQTKELYQLSSTGNFAIHIIEDEVTGNLIYQESSHGFMQVISKSQLTQEQVENLKNHGYK